MRIFWESTSLPVFRIVREYSRTKIRAESSSNGSKVAEWRFHSALPR